VSQARDLTLHLTTLLANDDPMQVLPREKVIEFDRWRFRRAGSSRRSPPLRSAGCLLVAIGDGRTDEICSPPCRRTRWPFMSARQRERRDPAERRAGGAPIPPLAAPGLTEVRDRVQ
jgi:hypothetical protein